MILVMTFLPLYIRGLETHMGAAEISAGWGDDFSFQEGGLLQKMTQRGGCF